MVPQSRCLLKSLGEPVKNRFRTSLLILTLHRALFSNWRFFQSLPRFLGHRFGDFYHRYARFRVTWRNIYGTGIRIFLMSHWDYYFRLGCLLESILLFVILCSPQGWLGLLILPGWRWAPPTPCLMKSSQGDVTQVILLPQLVAVPC